MIVNQIESLFSCWKVSSFYLKYAVEISPLLHWLFLLNCEKPICKGFPVVKFWYSFSLVFFFIKPKSKVRDWSVFAKENIHIDKFVNNTFFIKSFQFWILTENKVHCMWDEMRIQQAKFEYVKVCNRALLDIQCFVIQKSVSQIWD